ncbi:MAG: Gmad2 immunoglobulin-like domain-containing protein [Elusimicrobiales bacterium]|nr:Gmad2 immunoglobulin-like domain-containing protein [Elusimicrobiales bacterium]
MKSFFKNSKGSGLIGILVVISIMAALIYGGVFFSRNTNNNESETNQTNINSPAGAIQALDKAKKDIGEIQENYNQQAEQLADDDSDEYTIQVSNIKAGDNLVSPVIIEGTGAAFENTLTVELRNQDHETMVKEYVATKASYLGKSGTFKITLNFDFSSTKEGYVAVYEESAQDGSEVNLVEIPVIYNKIEIRKEIKVKAN